MATNLTQAENKPQLRFNWREWALLTIMGTLAALTALLALWTQFQQIAQAQHVAPLALLLNQVLQSAIQLGLAVAIGLIFARRTGLGTPTIENWLAGEKVGTQVNHPIPQRSRQLNSTLMCDAAKMFQREVILTSWF